MWIALVMTLAGIGALYLGGEWLVRAAARLAYAFGVAPMVVGLTVVAYGTSAPELVVGMVAAYEGSSEIVLGNVVGSNIANFGLVLGLSALIRPLSVEGGLMRREVPVLLFTTLLLPILLLNGRISRWEALGLLVGLLVFGAMTLASARGHRSPGPRTRLPRAEVGASPAPRSDSRARLFGMAALGLVLLTVGGKLFVDGASALAVWLGMSPRVVGLTIVALGTSAPELASTLIATMRGHAAIAVGNVIGSNICNVLLVLGGAALVRPIEGRVHEMWLEFGVLGILMLLALVQFRGPRSLRRSEGALLLTIYAVFVLLLIR